jgi:hypothetical protein
MAQSLKQGIDHLQQLEPGLMVSVFGMDCDSKPFFQHAMARNFSQRSALLEGVEYRLTPGEVIGVQCKKQRARARVLWVCEVGSTRQYKVSIHLAVAEQCPWIDSMNGSLFSLTGKPLKERRRHPRAAVMIGVEVSQHENTGIIRTHSSDLSACGCYVETAYPLSVGTQVNLAMWLEGHRVDATAIVRTSHAGSGMGLEFKGLTPAEEQQVEEFLRPRLSHT